MPAHALCEACVTNESRSAVPLDRPLTRPGPAQVFRVFKLVLLAKSAHGLVDLMHIVAISIVKSANIGAIALVIFYIYARVAVTEFGHVSSANINGPGQPGVVKRP
jgi:hypothetical protein